MISKTINQIKKKKEQLGWPILALCWVSFFWGTTWLASKEGVRHMPALQLATIRQFLAGLLYVVFFLARGYALPKGKQWRTIIVLSIINFMMSNGLSTWGVKYISSGLGAIIGAIVPIWIVLINYFKGEKMTRWISIGLMVSFVGTCVVFSEHLKDFLNSNFRFGIILSLISTVSWAFGTLITKKSAGDFNPYFGLGLQMLISSFGMFAITEMSGMNVAWDSIPERSWYAIGYLVIVGSVLTFAAFLYALQHLPAEISSVSAYINPIVAVLLGSFLFDEHLSWGIGIGGFITLLGLYFVNLGMRKQKKNVDGVIEVEI